MLQYLKTMEGSQWISSSTFNYWSCIGKTEQTEVLTLTTLSEVPSLMRGKGFYTYCKIIRMSQASKHLQSKGGSLYAPTVHRVSFQAKDISVSSNQTCTKELFPKHPCDIIAFQVWSHYHSPVVVTTKHSLLLMHISQKQFEKYHYPQTDFN